MLPAITSANTKAKTAKPSTMAAGARDRPKISGLVLLAWIAEAQAWQDEHGDELDGSHAYELTLDPQPQVDAFWSLTMYDMTFNFAANPIDRYAIGSLKEGYELGEDGGLTIYLQHDSPGEDKESNWLPSPDGEFFVVFRTYGPGKKLLSQEWELPGLARVED